MKEMSRSGYNKYIRNDKGNIAQLGSCFCMQLIKLVQLVNCTDASRCIIRIKYRLMVQIRRKAINKTTLWSLRGPLVEKRIDKSMEWLQEKMEGPRERNCGRIVTHSHAVSPVSREKIYLGGFSLNEDSISFAHTSTTMRVAFLRDTLLTASISRIRQMPALLARRSIEEGMVDSLVTQLATGAPSLQLTLL
uniref:Uncharacterized protein n=1 Tax=Trichogramma kaykai TaxID=54128 RepID=A0ABD2W383_9HYME